MHLTRPKIYILLALAPVVFFVWAVSVVELSRTVRIDLTENRLFTVSEGSVNLLSDLPNPTIMTVFFSDEASQELPGLRSFSQRMSDLLEQMTVYAKGQLQVVWKDPQPFSEIEDEALLVGLDALAVGDGGSNVYLGVVVEAENGSRQVIPFLSPQREYLLEYELIQAIGQAQKARLPRIGLLTELPIQSWFIYEQMQSRYDLIEIPTTASALPSALDLLIVIQPPPMSDAFQGSIQAAMTDQLPMLVFADPLIQSLGGARQSLNQNHPLWDLFSVGIDQSRFIADRQLGLQVTLEPDAAPIRHPAVLGLTPPEFDADDPVTVSLDAVNVATAGHWVLDAQDAGVAIVQSSTEAALLPTSRLMDTNEVAEATTALFQEIGSGDQAFSIAVRLREPTPAILVSDIDLLADRYWVSRQEVLGTQWIDQFAGNGDFVLNAIDNLVGDPSLIGLRSREPSYRPFGLVEEMRRRAEVELLSTEQALQNALVEANEQLAPLRELPPERLTVSQRAELEAFIEERLRLRQALRQVRRQLNEDIERLGQRIILINLLFVPSFLIMFFLIRWLFSRH